jgi:hypothetical protein
MKEIIRREFMKYMGAIGMGSAISLGSPVDIFA